MCESLSLGGMEMRVWTTIRAGQSISLQTHENEDIAYKFALAYWQANPDPSYRIEIYRKRQFRDDQHRSIELLSIWDRVLQAQNRK